MSIGLAATRTSRSTAPRNRRRWPWPFAGTAIVCLLWLLPLYFVVITAFKQPNEVLNGSPFALPQGLQWSNFTRAWDMANMAEYGLHSLVIAFIKVPLGIALSALAAFAFSRFRFRGRQLLFYVLLVGAMIPLQIALIPMFGLLLDLKLLNTYPGLLLVYLAFGFPLQVFMLKVFFDGVPRELDEAATIDGASSFQIFTRIVLPLSRPILAALFVLDFVSTFNEFQIALVVLQSNEKYTLPLGLLAFQGSYSGQYTLMTSAVVMASIPTLIVFLLFQRHFVAGLSAGAVKG